MKDILDDLDMIRKSHPLWLDCGIDVIDQQEDIRPCDIRELVCG
ncbi:hypothetical protein Q671_00085 [Halomonas sp. PBN3]|nr:hypothetical protein Q671_00085 [Halomonas sp. PBN3]